MFARLALFLMPCGHVTLCEYLVPGTLCRSLLGGKNLGRNTVISSVNAPILVLSFPPPQMSESIVQTMFYPRGMSFNVIFSTKSSLPLWYPGGQLYYINVSLSPRGQHKKRCHPGGLRLVSAVFHSTPLRLICNEQCASVAVPFCSLFIVRCLII